jgi:hypothetical protein
MNIDYQVNNQKLKTALDDFVKVGIGGRRRKKKLKYASEEARFDFQGDVLNITHNGITKGVEAKGKGIGRVFINWKFLAYFSTYEKDQEYLRVFVEDNLFHLETLSFPCTKTETYSIEGQSGLFSKSDPSNQDELDVEQTPEVQHSQHTERENVNFYEAFGVKMGYRINCNPLF